MNEFEPYLKQIKEGKLQEFKNKGEKKYDFFLLMQRTGLSDVDAYELVDLALRSDDPILRKKLLQYAKVS